MPLYRRRNPPVYHLDELSDEPERFVCCLRKVQAFLSQPFTNVGATRHGAPENAIWCRQVVALVDPASPYPPTVSCR